jgi:predicted DCC family thiol-disulfide oxidoreductase YuxK
VTDRPAADPTGHGAGGISGFTVLYDQHCPLCRAARHWLATRAQLVPLDFVPAGSAQARARFPELDHDATLRDLTVVADSGEVYVGDAAWLACLWSLAAHRGLAEQLARPQLLPLARRFVAGASGLRERLRDPGYGELDDRATCADQCRS